MKSRTEIPLAAIFFLSAMTVPAQAQENKIRELPRWSIKTNLLWDATATVNLGVEFRTGGRTSIDLPFNYNTWSFSESRKWKHFGVQPELRWWMREIFDGHFFGLHSHYAQYNVGGLPHGPFSQYMNNHRFDGWLAGAGVSYGYRWNFSYHWALEATVGAGYVYFDYDYFNCGQCGEKQGHKTKHYLGSTRAGISLIFGIGGKREPGTRQITMCVAPPASVVVPYEPVLSASFVIPETETVKARSASGRAYLDFAVGRSEIVPIFRNNAAELRKIHETIESVKNNPDATITGITITGYASPEGTWASNQSLSERRALSLKNHIRNIYDLREDMFDVWGAGEDWTTLDTLVAGSGMAYKYRVIEIIRGTGIFDGRESKLMALAGGTPYRQMKAELFPQLRRSDYNIRYTVAPFTVEHSKEVFRSRPGNLSLNEMFLIANTYEPGSDAFNEVLETAARVYPDSDEANINAAAGALNRKDAASAARYLDRVKERTIAYWNNMGMLAWLWDDKALAAEYFAKGGEQGWANAKELEKHRQNTTVR